MVSRQNCGRLHSSVIRPLPVINFSLQGPIEGWGAGDVAPAPLPERALDNRYSARYADMYDRLCSLSSSNYIIT